MKNKYWIVLLVTVAGCRANQEPLNQFIAQTEQQAQREVAQLVPSEPFVASAYQRTQAREPFVLPKEALVQDQPVVKKDCWQPQKRNKTGQLERYALRKLRLKGVMGSNGAVSALVQTPQGNVVKVKKGQYIGLNNGRVTRVASNYLMINETLPDGMGCWSKRNVKLAMK